MNILETAKRTLWLEAQALLQLHAELNDNFVAVAELLFHARGRAVVTGVGKSAIIARKIAATFNSTGTPALFMHAADAVHGDMGMLQDGDVLICLSKSGHTAELKFLIPLLRGRGHPVVGITAHKDSWLARQADYVLLTPVEQEADPNNLAPTVSSVLQMALGDALAVALLARRGFTPQDFATFHPGGVLGKYLYLRVQDLYTANERPTVSPDAPIGDVILQITSRRLGCTVVEWPDNRIAGIITDGDLRRMLERHGVAGSADLLAKDVMSPHPKCIGPDAPAVQALQVMRTHSITQLVVAQQQRYLGIIHLHDLIREGIV